MVAQISAVVAAFGVGGLAAGVAGHLFRTVDEPGVRWYAATIALFGIASIAAGTVLLVTGRLGLPASVGFSLTWGAVGLVFALFGLEYSGRPGRVPPAPIVAVAVALFVGQAVRHTMSYLAIDPSTAVRSAMVLLALASLLGFLVVGVGLLTLVQTVRRYGHLSRWVGVLPVVGLTLYVLTPAAMQNIDLSNLTPAQGTALFATGMALATGCMALPPYRFGMFTSTPAAGEVGYRQFVEGTDSLVIVTDHRGQCIETNETAVRTLELDTDEALGRLLTDIVPYSATEFRDRDIVELDTRDGLRQFKPDVATLTDQHDEPLGHIVTLTDITERRIREQRLEVLNRVLRHNLRNTMTQVQGFTEAAQKRTTDNKASNYLQQTLDATDELVDLGTRAREIQSVMDAQSTDDAVDLRDILDGAVSDVRQRYPEADVTVTVDDPIHLRAARGLLHYAVQNLVENGIEHDDSDPSVEVSVRTGDDAYPITVSIEDEGPGIPEHELETLEDGEETPLQHGSGLGLWITDWSVTRLGGDLSFDIDETGTTATIRLPHTPIELGGSVSTSRQASDD